MATAADKYAGPLPGEQRKRLRAMVVERGERTAPNDLHVTRWTLGRALAGLDLRGVDAGPDREAPGRRASMTVEDAIAERVAARLDIPGVESRIVARVAALRAEAEDRWLSPAAHARNFGVSVDTVTPQIARGELDIPVLSRVPIRGRDGEQIRDRNGQPRQRGPLRVRLPRRPSDTEIAALSAEARR